MNTSDPAAASNHSPNAPLIAEGQKLAGCYLLKSKVETAGSSEVWLAHDEVLGRDISLHFLPTAVRADAKAMEEIRKEVKKNRQLIHPHILRVHDLVEEPDFVAVSMDSFAGESLAVRLKQNGTLPPDAIQPWLGQLCQTLDDAHKVNLTHRDLAPSNLFLTSEGKVIVSSFGISRIMQDAIGRVTRGANPRLSYLSPQLADGAVPTKTDDVYSLGMLLFELLTGELPFNGGDAISQIKRVAAPRVSARLAAARKTSDVPASWDETIAAALRKDASQRPASASEVLAKLEKVTAKETKTSDEKPVSTAAALAAKIGSGARPAPSAPQPAPKPEILNKPEVPETASTPAAPETSAMPADAKPAIAATTNGALPSDPPPRKAVEILRERAAELARTKSSAVTPAPTVADKPTTPEPTRSETTSSASPVRKDASEIYPDLQQSRSRGPALALAAGIAFAAIAGTAYLTRDKEEAGVTAEDVELATTDESYASELRSVNHKTDLPTPAEPKAAAPELQTAPPVEKALAPAPEKPVVAAPRAPAPAPKAEPVLVAKAATPAAAPAAEKKENPAPAKASAPKPVTPESPAPALAAAKPEPAPSTPAPAPVAASKPQPTATQAPTAEAIAKLPEQPLSAAATVPAATEPMLLAANRPRSRSQSQPPAATPAPAAPVNPNEPVPSQEMIADKLAVVAKLKESLEAAEASHQELVKQQKDMEAASADIQKLVEQKNKEMAPMKKAMDDLAKARKQREDAQKTAETEAQKAQQIAADKTRLAEEARKAVADLEAQNQEKLAAQQRAESELAALREALSERQKAASTLSKAVAESTGDRTAQMAAIEKAEAEVERMKVRIAKAMAAETARKAREEAERLVAEKARERARIESEIAAMKKMFDEKMKVLEDAQKAMSEAEAKTKDTDALQKKAEEEALKMINQTAIPTAVKAAAPVPAAPAPAAPPTPTPAPAPAAATPPPSTPAPTPTPATAPPTPAPAASVPAPATPAPVAATAPAAAPMSAAAPTPTGAPAPAATPAPTTLAMKTEPPKTLTPSADPKPATPAGDNQPNSLGMRFVPVGDVQFSVWQTRVKDFEVFANAVNLRSSAWKGPGFKQAPDHPVVNVSWHEAVGFCKWLTDKERKEGVLPEGQLYRLPTDLEWSKAVGLPEETGRNPEARDMGVPDVYPWGTQWPPPSNAGNYTGEETGSDVAIKGYDDGFAWTSPVGSFPPNKLGLYDMGGNVWQWVMDTWNAESKHKVLRGASWYNGALKLSLLSSCRVHAAPDSSTDNYGFRIVRAPEAGKSSR